MSKEKLKQRAEIFVAYSSKAAVCKAARISELQLSRALGKGTPSPGTVSALNQLRLSHLEGYAPTVSAKGTKLRLRALYASGISMESLATWDRMNKPWQLDRRRLWRYAAESDADKITTAYHLWVRKAYAEWENIPTSKMDEACAQRALGRGWLRPIDLEEDLIDIPEPWAAQMLYSRVEDFLLEDLRAAARAVQMGERGQLSVAAAAESKRLDHQRRATNLRKQRAEQAQKVS